MLPQARWARDRHVKDEEHAPLLSRAEKGYGSTRKTRSGQDRHDDQRPLREIWMSKLDDDNNISALTIPGTHDSAAFTNSWPFIQTQNKTIMEQLNAGIRYFDLRCGLRDDGLEMVHGSILLGLTLSMVLDAMYLWLLSHGSEALVVQIKQDRKPERSTIHFANAIWRSLSQAPARWRTANTTPTLGELRGKIQLLRRFTGPTLRAYGIDVTQWQDNPSRPFTINTQHEVKITIQDHYSFGDPEPLPSLVTAKGGDVAELLNHAAADPDPGHWYMNFTSAYEFNFWYQLPPREVAIGGWWSFRWESGMNPRLCTFLNTQKCRRRFGIVAMDFPDVGPASSEDLITSLIMTNFGPDPGEARRFWKKLALDATLMLVLATIVTVAMLCFMDGRGR
ncbi:hypothetical protein LTR78_007713 [Recurvomyces mirabilis]|uniref:Phosphatidylinositol-specific phospholipase C X domain-containing protein n=1 Tax=Recurvomyces mirabilis TaxID=574656 RepID=A0AAE0WI01_9PEZI|nr:hypothetical protein LTR78_007713 [Recurvomyces mirabilis]KAK5151600.1 hypothetical protein LTS14_009087 [Recurvomyces mirabilis]